MSADVTAVSNKERNRLPTRPVRIGILVVAYNAVKTLASVLDRIPADFRPKITRVFVCDDFSQDSTYLVGLGYSAVNSELPLSVIRNPRNLGYGGNQKAGYQLAIENDLDIVVLLHGDGQYAPEYIADLVGPLERGECDAVFGSRMLTKGGALKGGMPLYKFVGNHILTRIQNSVLGMDLSEFHSGYRAYRVDALKDIDFQSNSDEFNFDTQIIIQLHDAKKKIKEVPIPTFYGDEISYVNGLKYAKDIVLDVLRYRFEQRGFAAGNLGNIETRVERKPGPRSPEAFIAGELKKLPPARVLALGCGSGLIGQIARRYGHHVTGVDSAAQPGAAESVDRLVIANLDDGIPAGVGEGFDVILATDVLEHVREPQELLEQMQELLNPRGFVLALIPNFGHWYSRGRAALGIFDYDQRGILDKDHVRFFTKQSFKQMATSAGFSPSMIARMGLPLEVLAERQSRGVRVVRELDTALAALRPTLFAYQFLFRLSPRLSDVIEA